MVVACAKLDWLKRRESESWTLEGYLSRLHDASYSALFPHLVMNTQSACTTNRVKHRNLQTG